jgi:NAD(P)-dependent dehydrogenase (short-subunit alcohol dehydrogenase family)
VIFSDESESASRDGAAGRLTDRVVLLTGASEGIGRALAIELAQHKLALVLAARNRERLEEVARECEFRGGNALAVPTDLVDPQQRRALIDAALARFGRLDVLINNAGATMWSRLDALADLSVFEHLMRINYLSAVHLTTLALPLLHECEVVAHARVVRPIGLVGIL